VASGPLSVVKFMTTRARRWTNVSFGSRLAWERSMVGPIVTFLGVCALVATFMWIAHGFLRAAEEPEDAAREEQLRKLAKANEPRSGNTHQPQWAH